MALKTGPMAEQLELFGCIQCGKCTGGCPVARKTVLNIRSMIYHMLVEGVYLVGCGQGPKDIPDTVAHAKAAASSALGVLARQQVKSIA